MNIGILLFENCFGCLRGVQIIFHSQRCLHLTVPVWKVNILRPFPPRFQGNSCPRAVCLPQRERVCRNCIFIHLHTSIEGFVCPCMVQLAVIMFRNQVGLPWFPLFPFSGHHVTMSRRVWSTKGNDHCLVLGLLKISLNTLGQQGCTVYFQCSWFVCLFVRWGEWTMLDLALLYMNRVT